jgi:hypothetical protein
MLLLYVVVVVVAVVVVVGDGGKLYKTIQNLWDTFCR